MSFTKLTTTALLALAALSSASPLNVKRQSSQPQPKDQEFSLALKAEGYPTLSLNIAHIAAGESQAVFQRLSAYPGTPAFISPSGSYLDFDVGTEYPYSMTFQEVGDNYGTKVPVYAVAGETAGRDGFSIVNQQLEAKLTAATQSFFVCPTTVNGEDIAGLFWGVYNEDGSSPDGCTTATLVQNFNVPGGASAPSS